MKSPSHALAHRSLWTADALCAVDLAGVLDSARRLKQAARAGTATQPLRGKNLALLSDVPVNGAPTRLHRAAVELGAHVAHLRPADSHLAGDAATGTARLLGRLYDAIDCDAMTPALVQQVDRDAGVPVYNGLGSDDHPARVLAELLGMSEASGKPLEALRVAYLGDPRTPAADALLQLAGVAGIDLRIAAPKAQWPAGERIERARGAGGGRLSLSESAADAVDGTDYVIDASGDRWSFAPDTPAVAEPDREDNRRYTLQALLLSTLV